MSHAKNKEKFFSKLIEYLNETDIISGVYTGHRVEDKTLAIEIYSFRQEDRAYPYIWLRLGWYEAETLMIRWGVL